MLLTERNRIRRLVCGCVIAAMLPLAAVGAAWATEPDVPNARRIIAIAKANQPKLVVRSFPLRGYARKLDGQWQGIRCASDGNVYFASSTHAHNAGAAVFRYDPRTGKIKLLCKDITAICGEKAPKTPPQGKIHSDFIESGGWIYFATHLANTWPKVARAYTGSHVVGYQLSTGRFRDFGVTKRRFSCYSGIAVDPRGKYIYNVVMPFYWSDKRAH